MNKLISKTLATILYSVVISLIVKYASFEVALLVILIQMYVELLIKGDSNE